MSEVVRNSVLNENPLVTFALFAYNQEKFIREAVQGAFSQTYGPMEILLSDDCSTDKTFEIMQEMVAAYDGPHSVRAVRNDHNIGVVPHVLLRGREAQGEIVVVAAGDDVSLPVRTQIHAEQYTDPAIMGISSAFDLINENGELITKNNIRPIGVSESGKRISFFIRTPHPYTVIQGSTASYRKKVFDLPLPEWHLSFAEDNLFNFLIYAHSGYVAFTTDSLVQYRTHDKALSNRGHRHIDVIESEKESRSASCRQINKMITFNWIAHNCSHSDNIDMTAINDNLRQSEEIYRWGERSFFPRLLSLIDEAALHRGQMLKWKVARLFGAFPHYQPKIFFSRLKNRR
jgi:glycosyltransferase involved in cell wall biosynthesis